MSRSRVVWSALAVAAVAGTAAAGEKGGGRVETANETTPAEAAVVAANTRFALDLYARLKGGEGNLFFSPYSVSTALAMTSAGARAGTARQMAATLHLPADPAQAHAGFGALVARLQAAGRAPQPAESDTLVTANALWLRQGETFLPDFLETARTRYAAGARQVDFAADPEAARRTINDWVEQQTRHKVRDLIGPSVLDRRTALVLTNAIYFKGAWRSPFTESQTRKDAVFHAPGGRDLTVPMMARGGRFGHHDGGSFQALELPYQGDGRSMVILLPKRLDGLADLEATLTPENLGGWLKAMETRLVGVELPRFTLAEAFELRDVLAAMGMPDAFDPGAADFSGMTGRRDLAISAVIHKAFVDVNEAGTEAAAATAVTMSRTSVMVKEEPIPFRADHPFVVLIRDRATGSVLFLGRMVNPKP